MQNIKTYINRNLHACKAPLQLDCSLPDSSREACSSGAESTSLRSSPAPAQRAAAR
jgi:hypothetical protein